MLTNLASDRIKRIRRLAKAAQRRADGQVLVEGAQACREAAREGLVRDLYLTAAAAETHPEIVAATLASGGYQHLASGEYVRAISPDSQGLVAVAQDPWAGWSLAGVLDGTLRRAEATPSCGVSAGGSFTPSAATGAEPGVGRVLGGPARNTAPVTLVAVFEQVRDPGNAGTAIRAADGAGAGLVVFADQAVDPTGPKVIRASAGSYFHLPVLRTGPVAEIAEPLQAAGLRLMGADANGSVRLEEADLEQPTAWLFGNEARGLSGAATAASDKTVRIPIYGRAESLNLAMAATLCLYASAAAQKCLREADPCPSER